MNEKELTHIDLFSGIGGFTLAGEWAGFRTVVFCEKEEFCQKVLQKRFGAIIADSKHPRKLQSERGKQEKRGWIGDRPVLIPEIRDFDGTKWRGATLLTGGFPCQPFSDAGKKRGKEDDRYLWPEMLRIIKEARPRWVLGENVAGIFRMALDTVLSDLEGEGYSTGTLIIPACGLDAPHRRNRVWIVAHTLDNGNTEDERRDKEANRIQEKHRKEKLCGRGTSRAIGDVADSECKRPISSKPQGWSRHKERISEGDNSNASNPAGGRQLECLSERKEEGDPCEGDRWDLWQEDWYEVAAQFCRVDDGISDRIQRLKALGNAIVPQVAYEILKNIAWIERNE